MNGIDNKIQIRSKMYVIIAIDTKYFFNLIQNTENKFIPIFKVANI